LIDAPVSASHPVPILKVQRDTETGQEVLRMRTLTKGLAAGAVGLAVLLIPGGFALADDSDTHPTPVCTAEQRQERWETHDRLRAEILDQLREEGVNDPDQIRDQLRTRLHDAMEEHYGDMPGPQAGMGAGDQGGEYHGGPRDGTGARHGPMTG
jgi:hypothetical protein